MWGLLTGIPLLAVASSGAAADALPFEGKWVRPPTSCTGNATPEGGAPITVTAERLAAPPFMTCMFKSVLPGGASYRVEAICEASGRKSNEFFTFAVLDGRLYWSWAGKTADFDRCSD